MTDYALPSVVDLLAPGDLATLRSLGRRKTYADGTIIHQRGDSDASMGIVVEGVVKLYRQLSNGQQLLMVTVNPGQHYADNHAFDRAAGPITVWLSVKQRSITIRRLRFSSS